MFNRDSLGYDAANSDPPLYKSVPFLLRINKENRVTCGLLFNQSQIRLFDLGRESPPYFFSVEVEGGPYGYIAMLGGENYHEVLKNYYSVTGFPALPPLCSALGSLAPL